MAERQPKKLRKLGVDWMVLLSSLVLGWAPGKFPRERGDGVVLLQIPLEWAK